MSNEEKSFSKTSINWVIRIYGNTSSNLYKIRILKKWHFTFFLYKKRLIMEKYNIKELEEKIKRCKYIKVNEVNIDDVDELNEIKLVERNPKKIKF